MTVNPICGSGSQIFHHIPRHRECKERWILNEERVSRIRHMYPNRLTHLDKEHRQCMHDGFQGPLELYPSPQSLGTWLWGLRRPWPRDRSQGPQNGQRPSHHPRGKNAEPAARGQLGQFSNGDHGIAEAVPFPFPRIIIRATGDPTVPIRSLGVPTGISSSWPEPEYWNKI